MNGTVHLHGRLVYDRLDGRLDAAAEDAAQTHLRRCDPCMRLERECSYVVESLRRLGVERIQPPAGYWDAFWAQWSDLSEKGRF
ncbi:MAG TPA: zf-HC2 domain-containing protein [Gemmatimonadota bacterium]|nr:zf-HC2 domain-containing protein [Gemmatimonadota bacterium]